MRLHVTRTLNYYDVKYTETIGSLWIDEGVWIDYLNRTQWLVIKRINPGGDRKDNERTLETEPCHKSRFANWYQRHDMRDYLNLTTHLKQNK